MIKKLMSLLIAAALAFALLPVGAFAGMSEASEAEPEKAAFSIVWDFEADPLENGWQFIDSDGDNNNWQWVNETYSGQPIATSGEYAIRSRSFFGTALTPDNWAISPAVEIPTNADSAYLNYQVASYTSSWPETYRVYVLLDGETDLANAVAITEDLTSPALGREFEQRGADLLAYAGHSVQIAFRHYNCEDQYMFYIDDVMVSMTTPGPGTINTIESIALGNYVPAVVGETAGAHAQITVPDGAGYSVASVDWFCHSTNTDLTADDVFEAGLSYSCCITLDPDQGYGFPAFEGISVTVNGGTELYSGGGNNADNAGVYIWTVQHTPTQNDDDPYAIHEVHVNGWGTPVAGVAGIDHMFLTTPDNAPYYIIAGGWRDETDQQQMWNENHIFIAGHEYSEGCQIWAEEGYYFAEDCVFYADGGTEILDLEWCYVDEADNWICYMNIIPVVCQGGELLGDVDGDGSVTVSDVLLVLRSVMDLNELTDAQVALADVDGNGSITIEDVILILRFAMGIINEFPAL